MVKEELLDKSGVSWEAVERKTLRELPLEDSVNVNVDGERLGHSEPVEANAIGDLVSHPREGFQPGPGSWS